MSSAENNTYRVETDGFFDESFIPMEDKYLGKVLICFSGSDGKIELSKMLERSFYLRG